MCSCSDRQCEQRREVRTRSGRPVECSEPAEVIGWVALCHALESTQPVAQATTEGIEVLHVSCTINPDAAGDVNRVMFDTEVPCCGCQSVATVRAQNSVLRQYWSARAANFIARGRFENTVGGIAGTITCNQYRSMFIESATLAGPATKAKDSTDARLQVILVCREDTCWN